MMVDMPTTTIQDRLQLVIDRNGWNPSELAKRARLNVSHVNTVLTDKKTRKNLSGPVAYNIAWAGKVSLGWLIYGVGSPDDDDIPTEPPPLKEGEETQRLEDLPGWDKVAETAATKDGRYDYAVMAVGELPCPPTPPELTEYYVLFEAEKIAGRLATNTEERRRLDKKLRTFLKRRKPRSDRLSRGSAGSAESGSHPRATKK